MSHETNRAVEMTVPWKAWKINPRFSTLPTAPWKSLRDSHIRSPAATDFMFFYPVCLRTQDDTTVQPGAF